MSVWLLLVLILGAGSLDRYWWKCWWGLLGVPVTYLVWLLVSFFHHWLRLKGSSFGRCIGAMFGLAVATWLGFQYVLIPNGGREVVGLSSVYARATAMLFLGYWFIPMVTPCIKSKTSRLLKESQQMAASWLVQIIMPVLVWWVKPNLYLVHFVRANSKRSYTIQFSIVEQVGFTILVVLLSLLLLLQLHWRPKIQ